MKVLCIAAFVVGGQSWFSRGARVDSLLPEIGTVAFHGIIPGNEYLYTGRVVVELTFLCLWFEKE